MLFCTCQVWAKQKPIKTEEWHPELHQSSHWYLIQLQWELLIEMKPICETFWYFLTISGKHSPLQQHLWQWRMWHIQWWQRQSLKRIKYQWNNEHLCSTEINSYRDDWQTSDLWGETNPFQLEDWPQGQLLLLEDVIIIWFGFQENAFEMSRNYLQYSSQWHQSNDYQCNSAAKSAVSYDIPLLPHPHLSWSTHLRPRWDLHIQWLKGTTWLIMGIIKLMGFGW